MTIQHALTLIFSVLGIFTITIVLTRIFGLRTFAKMSSFDFASTVAIGSVLASVILNSDYTLLKGGIVLISIIGFQTLFSFVVRKVDLFKKISTNKPQIIMWKGKILFDKLKECNIGKDDLIAKLREANVYSFDEVAAVIFESTGDISILHSSEKKKLSSDMLTDVDIKILDK